MNIFVMVYLIVINLTSFIMMGFDKRQAIRSQRRVPEKSLFLVALLGGALGSLLGMQHFRHKTKHWTFLIGIPFLFILQLIVLYPMIYFGVDIWITYLIHFLR